MRWCCMQIREILQTDLNSIEGMNGSGEPETFFDAEEKSDNSDAPENSDVSGSITTLGKPHRALLFSLACCNSRAAIDCAYSWRSWINHRFPPQAWRGNRAMQKLLLHASQRLYDKA